MRKQVLWLEGSSGISGDMTVGALLDLGASEAVLRRELKKLPLTGYEIEIKRTKKKGLDACAFRVHVTEEQHHHRHYDDIVKMLTEADLEPEVEELAQKMFYLVAKAESEVHGEPLEHVHFHEVGAVDSIVDLVAAAVCIWNLGITETAVGPLREGCGTVMCQHGEIPVPVPATARIAADCGLRLLLTDIKGEMITPTGAAIAAALQTRERKPENCRIVKIGLGAGEKEFDHPNVLRAFLLEEEPEEEVWVLETNVDDCTGEQLGYVQETLQEMGALDVSLLPSYMKKNRPGYLLRVLCREEKMQEIEDCIFRETTTIGIRKYQAERRILERRMEQVQVDGMAIAVKVCKMGEEAFAYPEYEDVRRAAKALEQPWKTIYEKAREEGHHHEHNHE